MKKLRLFHRQKHGIRFRDLFIILTMLLFVETTAQKIEIVEENGCVDMEFRLTCRRLDSLIAILGAVFTPLEVDGYSNDSQESYKCPNFVAYREVRSMMQWVPMEDNVKENYSSNETYGERKCLRKPLNHRCSGKNHCSFKLHEDHSNSDQWGAGTIRITYACMTEARTTRHCNKNISSSDGFISNPGYPQYYVGNMNCSWTIAAPAGLAVEITILDLALRNVGPDESSCKDVLLVRDNTADRVLIKSCKENKDLISFESEGHLGLTISLITSSNILFPRRGFLIYYKILGCQIPELPPNVAHINPDGYYLTSMSRKQNSKLGNTFYSTSISDNTSDVSSSNSLHMLYQCVSQGYAFPDTLSRTRTLKCVGGVAWNTTLPDCYNITQDILVKQEPKMTADNTDMLYDVIIPSLIIAGLFIINAIVMLFIFKYRKRKNNTLDIEELGAIMVHSSDKV